MEYKLFFLPNSHALSPSLCISSFPPTLHSIVSITESASTIIPVAILISEQFRHRRVSPSSSQSNFVTDEFRESWGLQKLSLLEWVQGLTEALFTRIFCQATSLYLTIYEALFSRILLPNFCTSFPSNLTILGYLYIKKKTIQSDVRILHSVWLRLQNYKNNSKARRNSTHTSPKRV